MKASSSEHFYFRTSLKLLSSRLSRSFAWNFHISIVFSWIFSLMFWEKKVDLNTRKQSWTVFSAWSKASQMQQKRGSLTWANSSRTANSPIFHLKYFTFSASSVHLQQIQASTYATFTIVSFWKMRQFEPRQSVRWQILVPAQLPYGLES